jgi:hypothetical protein
MPLRTASVPSVSPRPVTIGRPGTEVFPEQAFDAVREIALIPEHLQVLENKRVSDEGGDFKNEWVPKGEPVAGRIFPAGGAPGRELEGVLSESATHIAALPPDVDVDSSNRLESVFGQEWIIVAERMSSNESSTLLEVRPL